mmetsp:Transcript_6745/g.8509  ORF Transcript_6745/g.8509 Transcript_6745/m.8509 type:complete len:178 (+) Transcript_6745:2-535(+)
MASSKLEAISVDVASAEDLDEIMNMYADCVKGMIADGIDQWDESYPNKDIIQNDIEEAKFYICKRKSNNQIIAGMRIDQEQDSQYLQVVWEDDTSNFMVVHRLGSKSNERGIGVGRKMMSFAESLARENGCTSIRLDTYCHNPKCMRFYQNLGYKEVGRIKLSPNKDFYHCFEKVLS